MESYLVLIERSVKVNALLLGTVLFFSTSVLAQQSIPAEITLSSVANLRYKSSQNILEKLKVVPDKTRLVLQSSDAPVFFDYRADDGTVKRSSNGFYGKLLVKFIPAGQGQGVPQAELDKMNSVEGGIYLSSVDVHSALDGTGVIPTLKLAQQPDARYLKYYAASGRLLTNPYSAQHQKRFKEQYNREIPMSSLPVNLQKKWRAIFRVLQTVGDRTEPSSRKNLFLDSGSSQKDSELAAQYSRLFETSGAIQLQGAWTIAVMGTAVVNGFPNVPCAEFMSEVIRQAYERAGYDIGEDFKGNNYLLWKNTAAVVNLARALYESGWIPWDPFYFKPKTGAIAMHAQAGYPGHTYMIGGLNGRIIVDNGSPRGRDLQATGAASSKNLIEMMYYHGIFFLPPGIIPDPWD
jgi:hypothetical protein